MLFGEEDVASKSQKPRPLASVKRPQSPESILGQEHIWAPGKTLWELAHRGLGSHCLLWGPPGVGKTSIARCIAGLSKLDFIELSATSAGSNDLKKVIENSRLNKPGGCLLFVDEIHRLNKLQQEILLPAMEDGSIVFIGATTENPGIEVRAAILSRCLTFALNPIEDDSLVEILTSADSMMDQDAALLIAQNSPGDGRQALNILEACRKLANDKQIDLTIVQDIVSNIQTAKRYDKDGDSHYDMASAMIKSIRASDPDAALYYAARMLEGGEPPEFISRRLMISASEDIGNANPNALIMVVSVDSAIRTIGMPEARILIGQAIVYLAGSPKSNSSYSAMNQAMSLAQKTSQLSIPASLKNPVGSFGKKMGHGAEYKYTHTDPEGSRQMDYLPKEIKDIQLLDLNTSPQGTEKQLWANFKTYGPKKYHKGENI